MGGRMIVSESADLPLDFRSVELKVSAPDALNDKYCVYGQTKAGDIIKNPDITMKANSILRIDIVDDFTYSGSSAYAVDL